MLQPGEEQQVTFDLPARALAVWEDGWVVEPGTYTLWAGSSSRPEDLLVAGFQIV
jgi:hypothetical protein